MSQFAKPSGFFGRVLAYGMALGHRDFYKNTAQILDLNTDDKYLEIGFGSGIFIKKYAPHAAKISGLDYSEDMVMLAKDINKNLVGSKPKWEMFFGIAFIIFSLNIIIYFFYYPSRESY